MKCARWLAATSQTRRSAVSQPIAGWPPHTTPRSRPLTWLLHAQAIASPPDRASRDRGRRDHASSRRRRAPYADYFETYRRKRNVIDYTRSHVATDTEADEIVRRSLTPQPLPSAELSPQTFCIFRRELSFRRTISRRRTPRMPPRS